LTSSFAAFKKHVEPCSLAEKHLQEEKKNKRQTELDGGI
jgi:hypothetical protein